MDRILPNNVADAHAEIRRLEALIRQTRQEIARSSRKLELLQGLTPRTVKVLGRPLLNRMLRAEADRAASEEAQRCAAEGPGSTPSASS
jgi:hypothetical protein